MDACGCGSCGYTVQVTDRGGVVDIATDLRLAPPAIRQGTLAALALHLGEAEAVAVMSDITKGKADEDPRYPALEQLIAKSRRDWMAYGEKLIEMVRDILKRGRLDERMVERLEELFRAHEAAVVLRFAGVGTSADRARAIANKFIPSGEVIWSDVDLAYRAAIGIRSLQQAAQNPDPTAARAKITNIVESFAQQPLTARDEVALHFARHSAALRMRKPIRDAHDAIRAVAQAHMPPPRVYGPATGAAPAPPGEPGSGAVPSIREANAPAMEPENRRGRELTQSEYDRIRPAVERAVLERRSSRELESDLREAVVGTSLTNDMERVARTELREAHAQGAYQDLKTQTEALGIEDPEVMKITSATGCVHCIRIWGRGGSKRYRLSQVEAWEAAGGNFGKPAAEWGPTIGPVHPQCVCGALLYFDPKTHSAMLAATAEIVAAYRQEKAA